MLYAERIVNIIAYPNGKDALVLESDNGARYSLFVDVGTENSEFTYTLRLEEFNNEDNANVL